MTRVLLLALLAFASAIGQTRNAAAEIKPVIERMHRAWETLGMNQVKSLYADNNAALYFDVGSVKSTGLQAHLDDFKPIAADWKTLKLTLNPDFQASAEGNLAWAAFTYQFEITPKRGEVMRGVARSTTLLNKRGGQWLIVHEHSSVPWVEQK